MKVINVGELIEILKKYDQNLPLIITREGNDNDYPIVEENIDIVDGVYFPNSDVENEPSEEQKCLRIGYT